MMDFFIHSSISRFARELPDHPALSFCGEEMSYQELEARSNQLAHALLEKGLRREDRVGIYMHKCLELGVAIYGILKAGGVFVPLDPFLPHERLEFVIKDCEIRHLVSANPMKKGLHSLDASLNVHVYGVDGELPFSVSSWSEVEEFPSSSPDVFMIDQDLGYIMYTSGSTGMPKGMMHTHRGSLSYARWGAQHVELRSEDRVASHAPLHFDLSIFDFFSTALAGGTVVLVPEPVTKMPASWTQTIESERISVVFTVPFTLIEMQSRGAMEKRDLSSLRWILFGGEPFPPKHLRSIMQALPKVQFTNVYGPAEAPSCTVYDVPGLPESEDPIPIGKVSRNSEGLILDEEGHECETGTPGELCIRSSTLTRGYWNRPDLNERVFLRREGRGPFSQVYFRTGDVVVEHEDGDLRFLGRQDRMVKTRGNRVELDDVEAALATHPLVSEAGAYVVPDGEGSQKILVAVTVSGPVDTPALVQHARAKLPSYALPREISIVESFPRTSGGKIDRKKLQDLK